MKLAEQADTLRRRHNGSQPLVLPNAWDVASARLVVQARLEGVAQATSAITGGESAGDASLL